MAEILLYESIDSWSADRIVTQLNAAIGQPASMRVMSRGGSPEAGYTMLAKMQEHGNVQLNVDGYAESMGAFMPCYANGVVCLDVTRFIFHRAAYPRYFETEATAEELEPLTDINTFLRAGLEAKVDVARFEEITGVTMDELFSMEGRVDVKLTAQEALEVGLVDEINPVTSKRVARAMIDRFKIAASMTDERRKTDAEEFEKKLAKAKKEKKPTKTPKGTKQNFKTMSVEKIKTENPEAYNEIIKLGAEMERARIAEWNEYAEMDATLAQKGIASGEDVTKEDIKAFYEKAKLKKEAENMNDDGEGNEGGDGAQAETDGGSDAEAKTDHDKEIEALEKGVFKNLNLKIEK